ncbi:MAG: 30S ribosomal protein S1, partial [Bacteroidales bacterium]
MTENMNVSTGIADFDWDAIDEKSPIKDVAERERMENLYGETLNQITEQEVIEGTVVTKNNREVVVNIGFKSDGIIP